MDRRQFVVSSAAAMALGMTHAGGTSRHRTIGTVGVQLFSIPRMLEKDFRQGIAMLAAMGYREIEMFGPFPFSAPEAIASWKAIAAQIGFSGSGFFGLSPKQVRATFDEHGMTVPSVHTDLGTLQGGMSRLAEAARAVGYTYVVLPSIPDGMRTTLDDYKRMADTFNAIGADAKQHDLRFAYHNHGYGLQPIDGQVPLRLLLERTDPSLVFFEMDVFWTAAGGADPVELLRSNPGRYQLMHMKDMREKRRFRGDGNDAGQWFELFPYMVAAGDGVMDLRGITAAARASGVQHFFVEQDLVANPDVALKRSHDFMKSL